MKIAKKMRNMSRNGPQYAIAIIAFALGLALLVPAYLLLTFVLSRTIETMPAADVSGFKQKLFVGSAILTLGIGPIMAVYTRTKQYLALRQEKLKALHKRVSATTTQAPVTKPAGVPKDVPVQPPDNTPVVKNEQVEPTATTQVVDEDSVVFNPVERVSTTFADIAGYEQTKKNMEFIVKCLQQPELLREVGAKIPAGILLYGPPGTGKTLMARAIAGTAGVNFYSANASEFVNTWVGQGAKNVRALYKAAKANAPSIVFIDELDAIGGQRTSGQNQEYRQTLNALLTEIDGMDKDSGVLTIAATNDFENLDTALVRAGRFDRKIIIPLPNVADRLAIIKLYAAKRHMASDISLEKLARETVGMSGSGISTLFNEASIRAVMANRSVIGWEDLDGAMTQMLTNGEAAKAANKEDLNIAAYHEAGHAIILRLLAHDAVQKVSIIGNTIGAVGLTLRVDSEDRLLVPVEKIRARIIGSYGGRAAEELVFGKDNITTGARQDLKDASEYIREYLECGAGDNLLHESAFAGGRVTPDIREAKTIASTLYTEALNFLTEHRDTLERVAQALLDKETLLDEELEVLL